MNISELKLALRLRQLLTPMQAYISCITDTTCVTVTAQASDEKQLIEALRDAGFRAKAIGINGRYHSAADHTPAAERLKRFSKSVKGPLYPDASQLKVPLRTNFTGELITGDVSITNIAIEDIMLRTADWYTTMQKNFDASSTDSPRVTTLAFGEGTLPLSLSDRSGTTNGVNSAVRQPNSLSGSPEEKYPPNSVAVVGMACKFQLRIHLF